MIGFLHHRARAWFWTAFYQMAGRIMFVKLGRGAQFEGWIDIPQRGGRISLGDHVHIGRLVEFSVVKHAELTIGRCTFIGRGTIISAHQQVSIGADVLIAEYVSIHDNNHQTRDPHVLIKGQGFEAEPLEIGDDCWIGAKSTLVKGAGLGRRCILGAAALLNTKLPDNTRAAGVPARSIAKDSAVSSTPIQASKSTLKNHPLLESRLQCALCSASDFEVAIPFPEVPVLRCRKCGFLYSGQVLPEKSMADYYAHRFASRRHLLGQKLNADMNFYALKRMVHLSKNISVLDAGCGYGFLLKLLKNERTADVAGVEISKQEISHARKILGLEQIYPCLAEIPPPRLFDLVTCFEVVEHLRDPVTFLRDLLRRVKPGGYLVVMTDNFASRACLGMGCRFPKWIPHSHISHFTPKTLARCLTLAGAGKMEFFSFTPWEIVLLAAKARLSPVQPPSACFSLEDVLATEMDRPFRAYHLRKLLNKLWLPLCLRRNKSGSLIYAVVRQPLP